MVPRTPIYMDYHATTPVDERVLEAMYPYFQDRFGNAASRHPFGWAASEAVADARDQVARLIGATSKDIVFTSGATESNNLAIKGVAAAYRDRNVPVQRLLFPVTVELAAEQGELLEQRREELVRMGMTVADFGDNTYVIKGVPAAISQLDPADILVDTLAALKGSSRAGSGGALPAAMASLFASLACKAAIKAGNALRPEEMLALLDQMEDSPVFSHCPHGRPVIKTFSRRDIERWFHRI